ncbi:creatininase family protein [Variovorax sp. Sphag1AA]|uniref:creatininase family protein n=1 Tax=Variovorax sp. Sphag1AA TaxID=2587027 RepID=UPI00161F3342|nr:creatininase family protein [Variovorax sp. Sphag1AA]MBB3178597.1 creatinine amidohydrolase [Variovorax sp. Sphag1AA]
MKPELNPSSRDSGPSIFQDTIAEMTYPEVEAAIERGAVALWSMGVIEQHGPHLPTATDVYIPSARLRAVKRLLAAQGIESIIIPPFYWGVNFVSASFPASIKVRAEVMIELVVDVIKSLAGDGVRRVFCISGHNDRAHNEAIFQAMCKGSAESEAQACFICEEAIVRRLGIDPADPAVMPFSVPPEQPPGPFLDIHAGDWETSVMLAFNPDTVRQEKLHDLAPTNLGPDDLAEWRKGFEVSRRVTPNGYFGDPAAATAERGRTSIEREAEAIVQGLVRRLA